MPEYTGALADCSVAPDRGCIALVEKLDSQGNSVGCVGLGRLVQVRFIRDTGAEQIPLPTSSEGTVFMVLTPTARARVECVDTVVDPVELAQVHADLGTLVFTVYDDVLGYHRLIIRCAGATVRETVVEGAVRSVELGQSAGDGITLLRTRTEFLVGRPATLV